MYHAQQHRRTYLQADRLSDNPLDLIHDILLASQGDLSQDHTGTLEAMLNTLPTLLNRPRTLGMDDDDSQEYERLVSLLVLTASVLALNLL